MAAKIPDHKFNTDQTPWARWVQNKILAHDQKNTIDAQSDTNTNQGQGATLKTIGKLVQELQDQVTELAARATYSSNSTGGFNLSTGTNTSGTLTPSITFTISQPRDILMSFFVDSAISLNVNSGGVTAFLTMTLKNSGGVTVDSDSNSTLSLTQGSTTSLALDTDISAQKFHAALPAGTYTLSGVITLSNGSTGTAHFSSIFSNAILQILG